MGRSYRRWLWSLFRKTVGGRVGQEEDQDVDVEADRVTADLHVPLLEDIEQPHLDRLTQKQQIVPGNDPRVDLGDDRFVEPDDTGKQLLAGTIPFSDPHDPPEKWRESRELDSCYFTELRREAKFCGCRA